MNDFESGMDILKKNSSMVKQASVYLYKYGDTLDEIVRLSQDILFLSLPNSSQVIDDLMKKANAYLCLATNNLNILTGLIDDYNDNNDNIEDIDKE